MLIDYFSFAFLAAYFTRNPLNGIRMYKLDNVLKNQRSLEMARKWKKNRLHEKAVARSHWSWMF